MTENFLLGQRVSVLETMLARLLDENRALTAQTEAQRYLLQMLYLNASRRVPQELESRAAQALMAPFGEATMDRILRFYGDVIPYREELERLEAAAAQRAIDPPGEVQSQLSFAQSRECPGDGSVAGGCR